MSKVGAVSFYEFTFGTDDPTFSTLTRTGTRQVLRSRLMERRVHGRLSWPSCWYPPTRMTTTRWSMVASCS